MRIRAAIILLSVFLAQPMSLCCCLFMMAVCASNIDAANACCAVDGPEQAECEPVSDSAACCGWQPCCAAPCDEPAAPDERGGAPGGEPCDGCPFLCCGSAGFCIWAPVKLRSELEPTLMRFAPAAAWVVVGAVADAVPPFETRSGLSPPHEAQQRQALVGVWLK